MMENTLENKAKFFALYLEQEVYCIEGWNRGAMICDVHKLVKEEFKYLKKSYIKLKPLPSISAEEAIFVFNLDKGDQPRITKIYSTYDKYLHIEYEFMGSEGVFLDNGIIASSDSLGLDAIMKLTKLGYHVGTTREVEYGWVKLKEVKL